MIRAHIHEPFPSLAKLEVVIANHLDDNTVLIMRIDENGVTHWDAHDNSTPPRPTLHLPSDTGRILLDALTRHYQGAEDTRQLRHDYERERARVDKHAEALGDIARTLATKVAAA